VKSKHGTRFLDFRQCLRHILDFNTEGVDAGVFEL
jgi:hypothetical protein